MDIMEWEKVARLLATNRRKDLLDFKTILEKIVGNVVAFPQEQKFRRLKMSKSVIKQRILDRNGGIELLTGLGFVTQIDEVDGEKYLVLPSEEDGKETSRIALLRESLNWFNETVQSVSQQALKDDDLCAEYVVSVKLPIGTQVRGGFVRHETICAVISFIELYFNEDKRGKLILRLPHDSTDLTNKKNEDGEHPSIADLGIGKRAVLICSSLDNDARESKFIEKSSKLTETLESDEIKFRSRVRESVVSAKGRKAALDEEKKTLVKQFQDDRHHFGEHESLVEED